MMRLRGPQLLSQKSREPRDKQQADGIQDLRKIDPEVWAFIHLVIFLWERHNSRAVVLFFYQFDWFVIMFKFDIHVITFV